ncbi:MAG: PIG-L deacetylase family protein [Aquificaceae bacterium]
MEGENEKGPILVVAPHPDDEVLGCGGTVYKHTINGGEAWLCVVTDGSRLYKDTDVLRRKEECLSSAQIIGFEKVVFLDLKDGELMENLEVLKTKLSELVKNFESVFIPHPFDHHPDHIAVSLSTLSIFQERPLFKLYLYSVYNTLRYNKVVDVTDVYDVKKRAMFSYSYSLSKPDIMINRTEGMMRSHQIHTMEDRLYETFLLIEKPMTINEILRFLSYDLLCTDPQETLLQKIKATQNLIEELIQTRAQAKIQKEELEEEKKALTNELNILKGSVFFKLYSVYHKLRAKFFPEGSLRYVIYKRFVRLIKGT